MIGDSWAFPEKYKSYTEQASIGRSRVDSFDNVMISISGSYSMPLFGQYLLEQSEGKNNINIDASHSNDSMPSERSAFDLLLIEYLVGYDNLERHNHKIQNDGQCTTLALHAQKMTLH